MLTPALPLTLLCRHRRQTAPRQDHLLLVSHTSTHQQHNQVPIREFNPEFTCFWGGKVMRNGRTGSGCPLLFTNSSSVPGKLARTCSASRNVSCMV